MLKLFWFGILLSLAALPVFAQTPPPTGLDAKAEAIIRSSMRVLSETDGQVTLSFPGHSFAPKTPILFFRKRGSRIEPIANAIFVREIVDPKTNKKSILVEIERDSVIKYPIPGDYAAPMTDPGEPLEESKGANDYKTPIDENNLPEENTRPGYLEFGMGLLFGNTDTDPSSSVNISKRSSGYRFGTNHFLYYSDFIPIGVELDSHNGSFPTTTYQNTIIKSEENVSTLNAVYRFKPLLDQKLAISTKLSFLNEEFKTNNIDLSLINTKINATGIGMKAQFDFVSPIWGPGSDGFPIRIQNVSADFIFYPMVTATDQNVISRGSGSDGSTGMQYRLSVTALAWTPFIPIFKRWILQASYGVRSYQLKFNGPTVGEPSNPEPVPENGTSRESENDYRILLGFRIDDPIRLIFFGNAKK